MTAQTIAYLKTSEFTLTGSPGRIVPQFMIDLIDTLHTRASTVNLQDPEYGAIGDGASHPLSGITLFQGQNTTGWTVTQWRVVFPVAGVASACTATTNELNFCAFQLAINQASAGVGALLYAPAGVYRFTNSNSVSDVSGTLTFPEDGAIISSTNVASVSLIGDSTENTILWWPDDLGAGHFAFTCINRLNTVIGSNGYWQDFSIVGPNASVALNAKPGNMHGYGWSEYRKVLRIKAIGFNGGLCVNSGGQTAIQFYECYNCFYGIYYDAPNASTDGADMMYEKFGANLCMKACIGVANGCEIGSTLFLKCGFFTSPYGIFKETGGSDANVLADCTFINTQFESLGNALVSDGLAAGSHIAAANGTNTFIDCQWNWSTTYNFATNPKTGVFGLAINFGPIILKNPSFPSNWIFTGITNGIFEVDFVAAAIILEGDLDTLFGNMVSAGVPIGKGGFNAPNLVVLENQGANSHWRGHVYAANVNPTLIVGSVLAFDAAGAGTVGLSAGNATEKIAGICAKIHTASGGWVGVTQQGYAPVVNAASNVIANGAWARASASGVAITSTGLAQTTSRNLGTWGNGSGVAPNLRGSLLLDALG